METITLANLYKKGVFQSISRLRYNENNYPYVTLLKTVGDKTSSTNCYFGQKTASLINDNFVKGDMITQFLKHAEIVQTTNKEGQIRFKLSTSDNSQYASKGELSEMWGSSEEKETFDLDLFKKEFSTQEVTTVPQGA